MNWFKTLKFSSTLQPWEMTQQEYIKHHKTGFIPSDTYDQYSTREGISWIPPKESLPILHSKLVVDGKNIELRQSGKKLRYVKTDSNNEVIRDDNGMATYLSDDEIKTKGLPLYDTGITVYDENGPIGWVDNSFGVPEVFVIKEYQRKGIGTYLLASWMKQRLNKQKLGQMTISGENMARSYHKKLVRDAIKNGKLVPQKVLDDYPELTIDNSGETNELV